MNIFSIFSKKTVDLSGQNVTTFVGEGCVISGNIKSREDFLRIDGVIEGDVFADHGLILGETGVVNGDVKTQEIVVHGTINGSLHSKQLEIKSSGQIKGSIITHKIQMDMGATYNGLLTIIK